MCMLEWVGAYRDMMMHVRTSDVLSALHQS